MPSVSQLLPLPDDGELGRRLRLARQARMLSQDDVVARMARLTGLQMHQTALGHIERGSRSLKFREAVALARVLDVPLRWLGGQSLADPSSDASTQTLDLLLQGDQREASDEEEQ